MAQSGPLTTAAQNFFRQFNAGQERQRQKELVRLQQQQREDIINAAELKRQQELDDKEDLALSIESAIGVNIGGAGESGEQRGPGRVLDFVFATDKSRKAFSEAVASNPSVSAPILNFLSKSNDFQLKQKSRQTDRLFRGWDFLQEQKKKGPIQFQEGIKQLVGSRLFSEMENKKLVQLSNQPNQDLVDLTIEKGISDTEPQKIMLDDELARRKEGRAEQAAIRTEERKPKSGGGLVPSSNITDGFIVRENPDGTFTKTRVLEQAEVGGEGGKASAVTKIFTDGTTIQAMPNGDVLVKAPSGDNVTGDARLAALKNTNQNEIGLARTKAGAKAAGSRAIARSEKMFDRVTKIETSIDNIDSAIRVLDAGARTGAISSFFPSIRSASVELDNIQKAMGLDVIGTTTFGALSKGELDLALSKALPTRLSPPALKEWLIRKKEAQAKLAIYLKNAAIYLGTPGNTSAGWAESQRFLQSQQARDAQTKSNLSQTTPQNQGTPAPPTGFTVR